MDTLTATISTSIDAPANEVWKALTTPELIKQYFFGTEAESDWQVGSPLIFHGEWQGKTYEDKGVIKANEQNRLLHFTYWSSMSGKEDSPENYANISYELFEDDGKTTLTVSQDNIANEDGVAESKGNWEKVLNGLKDLVEKK